ncbi:GNAT family N-acetyltransferase [Azospirillum sp. TSA2s]|uniref:GNAT family N-acetyltransferase n=1 Tax=Azospirillum sp. TSA2s TaxID=709810 RepID=UPI00145A9867|nr:GNAT family N-acetyltransferase [Azospirillum sp. TSA2s]
MTTADSAALPVLETLRLGIGHERALGRFFADILETGDDRLFHPHPFTDDEARKICGEPGRDLYYAVMLDRDEILAYGMLRGWNEGFAVPSLGILVSAAWRGHGLGRLLMGQLHMAARLRNAPRVRLKVYRSNLAAQALYRTCGYRFTEEDDINLIGYHEICQDKRASS